jgi:hypothetical protein
MIRAGVLHSMGDDSDCRQLSKTALSSSQSYGAWQTAHTALRPFEPQRRTAMRKRREGQPGEFWLSRRTGRLSWYIMCFDPKTRQTRRQATGTDDFAEAERQLAERFTLAETLEEELPADVPLTTFLDRYWHEHASKLPSKGSRQMSRTAVEFLREFVGSALVADLGRKEQERIVGVLRERGLSDDYIRRTFDTARAALRRAYVHEEIAGVPWNEIEVVLGHAIPSTTSKIDDRGSTLPDAALRATWPVWRGPDGG